MRLAILMIIFAVLIATSSLAAGLEITELNVHVDYDESYTYRLEHKDRIDSNSVTIANGSKLGVDILPGSNVTFTIRVENTFHAGGPEIKRVTVRMTIHDIDAGADLEEESTDIDLKPGDDSRMD